MTTSVKVQVPINAPWNVKVTTEDVFPDGSVRQTETLMLSDPEKYVDATFHIWDTRKIVIEETKR